MRVKFTQDWNNYKQGDIELLPLSVSLYLIAQGLAERLDPLSRKSPSDKMIRTYRSKSI